MFEFDTSCLTCGTQPSGSKFLKVHSSDSGAVSDVLKKHFWFTEVDFQEAIICLACWDQVNSFHRFYVTVQDLHQTQLVSLIVKSEPEVQESGNLLNTPEIIPNETNLVEQNEDTNKYLNEKINQAIDDENESDFKDVDPDPGSQKNLGKLNRKCKSREQKKLDDDYIKSHVQYVCLQCGQEKQTFRLLILHYAEAHGISNGFVACCGMKFYTKTRLFEHVQTIDNPGVFRCEQCQKNFTRKEGLEYHRKMLHATFDFQCDRCPAKFTSKKMRKKHLYEHIERINGEFACEYCGNRFKSSATMKLHIRRLHVESITLTQALLPETSTG